MGPVSDPPSDEAGARWSQVKTLSEAAGSPEYAETRAFYSRMGYEPLQEFPTLWSPGNPYLLMVKAVSNMEAFQQSDG